jgi:hypothetical protein
MVDLKTNKNFANSLKNFAMKTITLDHLEFIASQKGADLSFVSGLPILDFGGYGFHATETSENEYYGFQFFGPSVRQKDVIDVWKELADPFMVADALTVNRAKHLIGKKVKVSYYDVNRGTEYFQIVDIEERPSNQIGQTTEKRLLTRPINEKGELLPTNRKVFYLNSEKIDNISNYAAVNGKLETFPRPESPISIAIKRQIPTSDGRFLLRSEFVQEKGRSKEEIVTIGGQKYYRFVKRYDFSNGSTLETAMSEEVFKLFPSIIVGWDLKTGDAPGLEVKELDTEDWVYEWDGIFRRGSGAERLFVEKILE